jgi:hypothetical protein
MSYSIPSSLLPAFSFYIEITRSKPDRLAKTFFGASHGFAWTFRDNLAMNFASIG